MLWRKAVSLGGIAGLALTLFVVQVPASANDHDGSIAALITGTTDTASPPETLTVNSRTGTFDDVALQGVFRAGDKVCATEVSMGTVTFTTDENLLAGSGTLPGSETFTGTCTGGGTLDGHIEGGTFGRVGNVATAVVEISFTITMGTMSEDALVTVMCDITATPDPTTGGQVALVAGLCAGDTNLP